MTVTLLVPTLNEIDGVRALLPRIPRDWFDQMIVLDGGSTDGTPEFARSHGWDVVLQTRPGMRMGYMEAFPRVRGEIVVTFSPDGNSRPEAIPLLTQKIAEGYDLVIASRYRDGARSEDDTWLTGLGNAAFTRLISRFGFTYTDAMVMLRAYRRELPARLGLMRVRSDWYEARVGRWVSWEPLMSIRSAKLGCRIAEIPSDEPRRIDETKGRLLLPTTRIRHFRAGFACLLQLVEEAVRRDWAPP